MSDTPTAREFLAASLLKFKGYTNTLKTWVSEAADMHLESHPDYSTQGVQVIFDSLVQARGFGDRISWLNTQSGAVRTASERMFKVGCTLYQIEYDTIVAAMPRGRLEGMSWEDQASHYRSKNFDLEYTKGQCEAFLLEIQGMCKIIDEKSRSITSARVDLQAMANVLQFAHSLGELK